MCRSKGFYHKEKDAFVIDYKLQQEFKDKYSDEFTTEMDALNRIRDF